MFALKRECRKVAVLFKLLVFSWQQCKKQINCLYNHIKWRTVANDCLMTCSYQEFGIFAWKPTVWWNNGHVDGYRSIVIWFKFVWMVPFLHHSFHFHRHVPKHLENKTGDGHLCSTTVLPFYFKKTKTNCSFLRFGYHTSKLINCWLMIHRGLIINRLQINRYQPRI